MTNTRYRRLAGGAALAALAVIAGCAPSPKSQLETVQSSKLCIVDVEVGPGADRWRELYRALPPNVGACPFLGERTTVLAGISEGDCSSLKLSGMAVLHSRQVTDAEFARAARCVASVAESRANEVPGTVQVIQTGALDDPNFGRSILEAVARSGLPASFATWESRQNQTWFCFETLEGAGDIDLFQELTRFGFKWPRDATRLRGDWPNCSAAAVAYGGTFRGQKAG